MNLPVSLVIARRYAKASKQGKFVGLISKFSQAGIMLGVMALILVISVMDGFEGILKERILGAVPHVLLKKENGARINSDELAQLHTGLLTNDNNQTLQVLGNQQATAILQLPDDFKGVMISGLHHQNEIPLGLQKSMQQGAWSGLMETKYGIVISEFLAFEHGLTLGSKVRIILSGASHYTPLGRMPAQRNFTVIGLYSTNSELDQQLVFTRLNDLNRLLKLPTDTVEAARVVLSDPFSASSWIATQTKNGTLSADFDITTWHQTHGKLFDAVKMEKNMMWMMLSLIVAVAAFNIVSALVMMVIQKQGEVAILKTLGMNTRQISHIFTLQGSYNGLIGALLGAIIGTLLTLSLNPFMKVTGINLLGVPGLGLPVALSPLKVCLVTIMAMGLAYVASLYPAKRAANLAPADVLRYE